MALCDGFIGSIGNTPLIRLKILSDETVARSWVKQNS